MFTNGLGFSVGVKDVVALGIVNAGTADQAKVTLSVRMMGVVSFTG